MHTLYFFVLKKAQFSGIWSRLNEITRDEMRGSEQGKCKTTVVWDRILSPPNFSEIENEGEGEEPPT